MIIVRFNDPEEFAAELVRDRPENNILRSTRYIEPSKYAPIRYVSVVATFTRHDEIVRLTRYCGDFWGNGMESDKKTIERAEKVMTDLDRLAEQLKLEVRAGIYEEAKE